MVALTICKEELTNLKRMLNRKGMKESKNVSIKKEITVLEKTIAFIENEVAGV